MRRSYQIFWHCTSVPAKGRRAKILKDIFHAKDFDFPKSVHLVADCLRVCDLVHDNIVFDYFAGSGTTGHAVINLNREDGGRRKFILVEMADYFDTVLLPRIKKVTFTPEWREGKPKRMATAEEAERSPRIVKVIRLEILRGQPEQHRLRRPGRPERLQFDDYLLQVHAALGDAGQRDPAQRGQAGQPLQLPTAASRRRPDHREVGGHPRDLRLPPRPARPTRKVHDDADRRYLVYRGRIDHRQVAVIWRDTEGWGQEDYERDR